MLDISALMGLILSYKFYSKILILKNFQKIKNKYLGGDSLLKKSALKIVFNVCLSLLIAICVIVLIRSSIFRKYNENKLLKISNSIINENIISGIKAEVSEDEKAKNIFTENIEENSNVIGKLIIEKIKIVAPILEGIDQNILKVGVGHFPCSAYWKGNVCLASHNRGSYAHYFEKINMLNIGDEVKYQTKLGTRIYTVNIIDKISENDLSVLDNTDENTITLITCVKGEPEFRLCVRGIEKNFEGEINE